MTRTKLGLLGLCAVVVGIMSMSASAAQGATLSWLILNSAGTEAKELKAELVSEKDSATLVLHVRLILIPAYIVCRNHALKGVNLEAGGNLTKGGKVVFTECNEIVEKSTEKQFKCTVKSPGAATGTIETNGTKGELILAEGEVQTKVEPIEPVEGPEGNFATIRFEGSECTLPETIVIHGVIVFRDCKKAATNHEINHLLEANALLTHLYLGKHSAEQLEQTKLLGSVWVKLGGAHAGLKWAAMDV